MAGTQGQREVFIMAIAYQPLGRVPLTSSFDAYNIPLSLSIYASKYNAKVYIDM